MPLTSPRSIGAAALAALTLASTTLAAVALLVAVGASRSVQSVASQTLLQRSTPLDVIVCAFVLIESIRDAGARLRLARGARARERGRPDAGLHRHRRDRAAGRARDDARVRKIDRDASIPVVEMGVLRNLQLFASLPAAPLETLAHEARYLSYPPGAAIIAEGEDGDRYYAITDGEVARHQRLRRGAQMGRGEGFGEIALLHPVSRTATVTASEPTTLLAIDRDAFLGALNASTLVREAAACASPARCSPRRRRISPPLLALRRSPSAALAVAIAVLAGGCSKTETSSQPSSCQGSSALCSRRLNSVYFAATHNSYAASDQPGWRFASQNHPISRQLDDGIRALLIDVHYGVRDPSNGRVRTDFEAEGSEANKVAEALPGLALRVADHIAGGIGLGGSRGEPKLYLCHTLCELGAEPLEQELGVIAAFLRRHPDQVLMLIVEDYVPPSAVAAAFEKGGLERYAASLRLGEPPPTLGELVSSGKRLLVFAEKHGGKPSWYMPAFSFIADTPLGAVQPGQLSCKRFRGEERSPLLLINHWIPPFPPSPTLNEQIGRAQFVKSRIGRCTRALHHAAAIVAVDFYQRTSVVAVTRRLNEGP